jgi:hypothetical protein
MKLATFLWLTSYDPQNRLKTYFFEFSYAYHFATKYCGELGDPTFYSELFALSDDYILK